MLRADRAPSKLGKSTLQLTLALGMAVAQGTPDRRTPRIGAPTTRTEEQNLAVG